MPAESDHCRKLVGSHRWPVCLRTGRIGAIAEWVGVYHADACAAADGNSHRFANTIPVTYGVIAPADMAISHADSLGPAVGAADPDDF